MRRQLGATCIVVTLSLSQALAMSPGEAFKKFVEDRSLEECLEQPNDACVFELAVTAAKESGDDENLRDVARMQAGNGSFERALSAASRIDEFSSWYPWALADIVVEQARAGRVKEALETADAVWHAGSISPGKPVQTLNPLWTIRSLCAIASAQARSGDEDAGKKNLTAAMAIAEQSTRSELYAIGRAWHYIVEARLDVDGLDGAQRSLESMRRADSSSWWVILSLNSIAMAQASAGLGSQALETFSEARRLATELASSFYLSRVAVAQMKAGYASHAMTSFSEAVETARKEKHISTRIDVLSNVSQAQREAGLHKNAKATANIAISAARSVVANAKKAMEDAKGYFFFDEELKVAEALMDLASAEILAGRVRGAEITVNKIRGFSQFYYAWAMAELAIAQWKAERGRDAAATIDAAQKSARVFDSEPGKAGEHYWYETHWYKIAVAKATVGDVRGALRIGEQHMGATRFHIFRDVAELMAKGGGRGPDGAQRGGARSPL